MVKQLIQGIVIGIANIIPGVSGGTMMVAMGLYDKLIYAITHIKTQFKQSLKLLIPILIGAGIAVVLLSKIFTFLLTNYQIPTNFAFCGLIAGSLPFMLQKVKGSKVNVSKSIIFLIFFALVIVMALLGEKSTKTADISFSFINVLKLFFVGIITAGTMVIPGVSGSLILMLLGYYDVILKVISDFVNYLFNFNIDGILTGFSVLIPFGIGIIVGIIVIAKIIEIIFKKAEVYAYYGIIGLILASPIAILLKTDWTGLSIVSIIIGLFTFGIGWLVASKLGGE